MPRAPRKPFSESFLGDLGFLGVLGANRELRAGDGFQIGPKTAQGYHCARAIIRSSAIFAAEDSLPIDPRNPCRQWEKSAALRRSNTPSARGLFCLAPRIGRPSAARMCWPARSGTFTVGCRLGDRGKRPARSAISNQSCLYRRTFLPQHRAEHPLAPAPRCSSARFRSERARHLFDVRRPERVLPSASRPTDRLVARAITRSALHRKNGPSIHFLDERRRIASDLHRAGHRPHLIPKRRNGQL